MHADVALDEIAILSVEDVGRVHASGLIFRGECRVRELPTMVFSSRQCDQSECRLFKSDHEFGVGSLREAYWCISLH